jgi:hypothetical protein
VKHSNFQAYIIFCENVDFVITCWSLWGKGIPYVVKDSIYHLHPYLWKNFKAQNSILKMEKIQFDQWMSRSYVVI